MTQKKYLNWEEVDIRWDQLDMTWDDLFLLIEVGEIIRKHGGPSTYVKNNPWELNRKELGEEKSHKFINLFCKINDLNYEKAIQPNSKIKITVNQIEKVFSEITKITVNVL